MARLRRYELYDGDGEMIPEEYVPLQERGEKTEAKKPAGNPAREPRNRKETGIPGTNRRNTTTAGGLRRSSAA